MDSIDTRHPVVRLRVAVERLSMAMDHLDRAESCFVSAQRRHQRIGFRTSHPLPLILQRPEGPVIFEAAPRNLSPRGAALLVGGFVHPNTGCTFQLRGPGGEEQVSGAVRWCRHVSQMIHEVGVEFNDRVDIGRWAADPEISARRGEIRGTEFQRFVAQEAARLARLAEDQRALSEIRETFDRIRRAMEREEAQRSPLVK